ncbi:MAG: hypothetical protein P1P84_23355 [Deferrisomatales bacterium]|nr:hypothetical protein [Deferrisomatales bacterium]
MQIDGAPADVQTGPDCQLFLLVLPTGDVTVVVSVDGIAGTIELTDVVAGEVVEIEVQAGAGSLSIQVLRFEQPVEPLLATVIDENDVHIELPAGVYDQTLTVNGNGLQLTGETGGDCAEGGWTTITGAVVVQGNNASFTNIKFLGPVTVLGNNVRFSHVCFENKLLILGERPDVPDEEEPAVSCDEAVDFEGLRPGTSVLGPGAVHPDLEISVRHETVAGVVVVAEGSNPTALYTAPQEEVVRVPNGCLGNPGGHEEDGSIYGQGFGDLDGVNDYTFAILNGKSVNSFSLTMLDFGDFNPELVRDHRVELVAYTFDGAGNRRVIDRDELSYQSLADELPTVPTRPDVGDLQTTGDACTAQPGQPGNFTFQLQGPGITHIALAIHVGPDPQIAFDNLRFRLEQVEIRIDVLPTINTRSNGVIPVAIFGDACFDLGTIDFSSLLFGPAGAAPAHDVVHGGDHFEDHDGDGTGDVVVHFRTQETGIEPAHTSACLEGQMVDRLTFRGCDSIRIAPGSVK